MDDVGVVFLFLIALVKVGRARVWIRFLDDLGVVFGGFVSCILRPVLLSCGEHRVRLCPVFCFA